MQVIQDDAALQPACSMFTCSSLASLATRGLEACLVLAGADCRLRVSDLRRGLAAVSSVQLADYPYSVAAGPDGQALFCGLGTGSVPAADAATGQQLWSQRCNAAAVRTLHVSSQSALAAGDDGSATSLQW